MQEVVQTLTGQLLVHQETSVVYRLVNWGGDFAMAPHQDGFSGHWNCQCGPSITTECTSGAPFLTSSTENQAVHCWARCGCWTAPYATGGKGGQTQYCGRCCAQGGQGGSGVVRITYV